MIIGDYKIITGIIRNVRRFDTSRMGNPRYQFDLEQESGFSYNLFTDVNCKFGYSIQNFEDKQVKIETRMKRNKEVLTGLEEV